MAWKIGAATIGVLALTGCLSADDFQGDPAEVQKSRVACAKGAHEASPTSANIYSDAGAKNAIFFHCMGELGYPLKHPYTRFTL